MQMHANACKCVSFDCIWCVIYEQAWSASANSKVPLETRSSYFMHGCNDLTMEPGATFFMGASPLGNGACNPQDMHVTGCKNLCFVNCLFTAGGNSGGGNPSVVIGNSHNIIFRNCLFNGCNVVVNGGSTGGLSARFVECRFFSYAVSVSRLA